MSDRLLALVGACALLAGCTAVIDQSSFFPALSDAPSDTLQAPPGYQLTREMIPLSGLGTVHAVRLDNPASDAALIYHGGNGNFVAAQTKTAAALAQASGADIILYDYPGRGGTNVPPTIEASIATGPALLGALRERGWVGRGPLFAYGYSFGGSQAAAMARNGGFDGLIIEGSAADIAKVGRNFIPTLLRPFVRLQLDPALQRFDYLSYASASRTPVLLLSSRNDRIVTARNMRAFADQLRARQVPVTLVSVPGGHGSGLDDASGRNAVRAFVQERSAARTSR